MNESSTDHIHPMPDSIAAFTESIPVDENATAPSATAPSATAPSATAPSATAPSATEPLESASAASASAPISVDGVVNASAPESDSPESDSPKSSVSESNAPTFVPNAPTSPPRALTPGAFLRGEIEVKSVVSRGLTNIYEAAMGDYGAMTAILLAERETAPQDATAGNSTESEPPLVTWQNVDTSAVESSAATSSTRSAQTNETAIDQSVSNASTPFQTPDSDAVLTVNIGAQSGAFVEDVDALPTEALPDEMSPVENVSQNAPLENVVNVDHFPVAQTVSDETATGETIEYSKEIETPTLDEVASLFVAGETFRQDEREYKVFEHFASTSLQDWREPSNDERLLKMLNAVAQGLIELEKSHHRAQFTTETLRVDANGDLKFLGFVESGSFDALGELRRVAAFLFKQTFAEAATMRLDDQYGALAFSEELKSVARRLDASNDKPFQSLNEAAQFIASYASSTRLRADFSLLSDVGQERELNEDAGLIITTNRQAHLGSRAWELYIVADGMGGHEGGEVASDLTLTSLVRNLEAQEIDFSDNVAVRNALFHVIDAVNAEVVALTETPKYKGTRAKPGSTLTFALRVGTRVFVGNVGDSRTYKYSNRVLERISKDHSYVQTLIDNGEITEDEAFTHPDGSVITAHIGYPKLKQRDVFLRLFRAGESLLLVSDGVTDMLRDADVAAHLSCENPEDVCRALVDASNAAGGIDNITVVCVKFR